MFRAVFAISFGDSLGVYEYAAILYVLYEKRRDVTKRVRAVFDLLLLLALPGYLSVGLVVMTG